MSTPVADPAAEGAVGTVVVASTTESELGSTVEPTGWDLTESLDPQLTITPTIDARATNGTMRTSPEGLPSFVCVDRRPPTSSPYGCRTDSGVVFEARVGHDAPMGRQVFDARRGLLALGGFLFGVILTKWFGVIGFIALAVLLVVGIPLIAVISARRAAARASRTPPS